MAKFNGTSLLLYADGVVIAGQRGCGISVDVDLPETTDKFSGGWQMCESGKINATVDFDALMSTTGLSAVELMNYIINQTSLYCMIVGSPNRMYVGEVNMKSIKIEAPVEGLMALTGSMTLTGKLLNLKQDASLITSYNNVDFDTFVTGNPDGSIIVSAIDAGAASAKSNTFTTELNAVYLFITVLTLNTGELPIVRLHKNSDNSNISIARTMNAGFNYLLMTATEATTAYLRMAVTDASSFITTKCYLIKL